jgi:hypothetical protein
MAFMLSDFTLMHRKRTWALTPNFAMRREMATGSTDWIGSV